MEKILDRGAEAILFLEKGNLVKKRVKKGYRINELDEKIRKLCTRRETKLLEKASLFVKVPELFESDDKKMEIRMEFVKGKLLKNILDELDKRKREKILEKVGEQIALLHLNGIIHGDLTTSNMILRVKEVYFIDFGLGFFSLKVEDKAVDLHLLKQALESKHYKHFDESFKAVLSGYKKVDEKQYRDVIERLNVVEKRGRYKRKKLFEKI